MKPTDFALNTEYRYITVPISLLYSTSIGTVLLNDLGMLQVYEMQLMSLNNGDASSDPTQ